MQLIVLLIAPAPEGVVDMETDSGQFQVFFPYPAVDKTGSQLNILVPPPVQQIIIAIHFHKISFPEGAVTAFYISGIKGISPDQTRKPREMQRIETMINTF